MDITRRLINLSWVSLLHRVECGCVNGTAPIAISEYLKGVMAAVLDERQRRVLTLRWGLKDGIPMTLDVVGLELGVTRERIRQIEARAIRKLKAEREKRRPRGVAAPRYGR
jgi:DNA-directed RNA polymerase sigma subunit (sigma70/sigma32)